jgi:hypothetical protein
MPVNYLFSVKSIKYGTPTGLATMPGSLTALPNTVKGSVTFDEAEGSSTSFFVDQMINPIKVVATEGGALTLVAQFYDMTYSKLAALKGGTGSDGSSFKAQTGFSKVELALAVELDSGQTVNIYNANCFSRITGGGGRDKMLAVELKATSQVTADLLGTYDITGAMS